MMPRVRLAAAIMAQTRWIQLVCTAGMITCAAAAAIGEPSARPDLAAERRR
jgi:hypothetical protein